MDGGNKELWGGQKSSSLGDALHIVLSCARVLAQGRAA